MQDKQIEPPRAAKGSIGAHYPLKMPAELDAEARKAAKRVGKSYAEWLREAIRSAIFLQRAMAERKA